MFNPTFRPGSVFLSIMAMASFAVVASVPRDVSSPDPVITRGPYLQKAASDSICIVWRTAWSNITPVVRYGRIPTALDLESSSRSTVVRAQLDAPRDLSFPQLKALRTKRNLKLPKLHSAPTGTFQYEVTLTKLEPNAHYFYAIYDGDRRLTPLHHSYQFATHPPIGQAKPVRFWVTGDGGTARKAQWLVYESMLNVTKADHHPIDFTLHVGDMAYYEGKDNQFQTRFFDVFEPTLRQTVCWPTFANHEGVTSRSTTGIGPYFDAYVVPMKGECGGEPSGREGFYSFDFGRVHFISLDSHELRHKATNEMISWLKADLKRAKETSDWLMAWFHHPAYTKGSHDGDKEKDLVEMRRIYQPILDQGGVDVVFNGHSHTYERTMLIDGAYGTNMVADGFVLDDGDGNPHGDGPYYKSAGINPRDGTVHVVTGHGGTTLGRKGTIPMAASVFFEHGSTLVDIAGDTLVSTMIDAYGTPRDQFSIVKRGKVSQVRFPKPWKAPDFPKSESSGEIINVTPPVYYTTLIPRNGLWQYLAGSRPRGHAWTLADFKADGWKTGAAGFGYTYPNNQTVLTNMRNHYTTVYLRREFQIEQADRITALALLIDYDDAFIAYLNGHEVARNGVDRGKGADVQGVKAHDAKGAEYILLSNWERYLKNGPNILAIEGHNHQPASSDFILDPMLIAEE
jgi:hypothetical protein